MNWPDIDYGQINIEKAAPFLESGPPAAGLSRAVASLNPEPDPVARPEIDLAALARQVYLLLKEELRVEQERLGRDQPW
jgi:hypothetical protein